MSKTKLATDEAEKLRVVLRSIISGGMSNQSRALAMNALEPGTGDRYMARIQADTFPELDVKHRRWMESELDAKQCNVCSGRGYVPREKAST